MPEVFISYARANEAVAKRVEAGLIGLAIKPGEMTNFPRIAPIAR